MRKFCILARAIGITMLAGGLLFLAAAGAHSQSADQRHKQITVKPTDVDNQAAKQATVVFRKAWSGSKPKEIAESKLRFSAGKAERGESSASARKAERGESSSHEIGDNPPRYPGDLSFQGGAVVEFAESHAIYMLPNGTCPIADCWGNPEGFLRDLGRSEFIHVTDQYVGHQSSNRYTVGQRAMVPFIPSTTPFTDNDMLAVIHAVASLTGQPVTAISIMCSSPRARMSASTLHSLFAPQMCSALITAARTSRTLDTFSTRSNLLPTYRAAR